MKDKDIVKENQIMEEMFGPQLKDEVIKMTPMLNKMRAQHKKCFKHLVVVGFCNGYASLGVKCNKEVVTVIHGVLFLNTLFVIPVSEEELESMVRALCKPVSDSLHFDAHNSFALSAKHKPKVVKAHEIYVEAKEEEAKLLERSTKELEWKPLIQRFEILTSSTPPSVAILWKMEEPDFFIMHSYELIETAGLVVSYAWKMEWDRLLGKEKAQLKSRQVVRNLSLVEVDVKNLVTMANMTRDASLLALELGVDLLILLSDVDGLYNGPPSDPHSKLIHLYIREKHNEENTFGEKSRVGRGGMTTKVKVVDAATCVGILVVITSGYSIDGIVGVL
ncbi:hypothetical protein SUGI_0482240 [Cryptomeria japonica]|nr:hypothetical protein SUGI_0482240 [Cryptomeria japonica]